MTAFDYQGPRRGADRAVLLAPGAGADRHAAALTAVADALEAAKIPSLRFDFAYRAAGRRAPDRPPVLAAALRDAAAELGRRARLAPERIVIGGRSMGGRVASLVAAGADGAAPFPALGLLLLGYPLHPPGRPERRRDEHFPQLRMPALFVEGTRDAFGSPEELKAAARKYRGRVEFHWIETGDHGFRPLKASGLSPADARATAAARAVEWVAALG